MTDSVAAQRTVYPVNLEEIAFYRRLSLSPHGFGSRRTEIWAKLLHVPSQSNADDTLFDKNLHRDERQIGLDTSRSFIYYPVAEVDDPTNRTARQAALHTLIVTLFRRHSGLSYFQGFHDIISVLFLTLPPDMQYPAVEYISLYRCRDSMGSGLEPVLALLRALKYLLRLADSEYAKILENASPLPYHALPHVLTLFSHDAPSLPLAQHFFDWLLCRPPIACVYLCAAFILARKSDVIRLEREGEEGMVHSLLGRLPELYEDTVSLNSEVPEPEQSGLESPKNEVFDRSPESSQTFHECESENTSSTAIPDISTLVINQEKVAALVESSHASLQRPEGPSDEKSSIDDSHQHTDNKTMEGSSHCDQMSASQTDSENATTDTSLSARGRASLCLPHILAAADALMEKFPSAHPAIQLSALLGPNSVIFEADLSMDEAETIACTGDSVIGTTWAESEDEDESKEKQSFRRRVSNRRGHTQERINTGLWIAGTVLVFALSLYAAQGHHGRDWKMLETVVVDAGEGLGWWS